MKKVLISLIEQALNQVSQDYYRLRTTYSTEGIVRERVFCYELYHQMRKIQDSGESCQYHIHGEIDKRAHELFAREDQKNPDFVFHCPGSMGENALVVEVKGKLTVAEAIKDFDTLKIFCAKYGYQKGLWLLYNHDLEEAMKALQEVLSSGNLDKYVDIVPKITIMCKKSCDTPIQKVPMAKLLKDTREQIICPNLT